MVNAPATASGSPLSMYAASSSSAISAKCTVVAATARAGVPGTPPDTAISAWPV